MELDGVHGPDKKKSAGRPKYRLVDEKLGKEIDVSAMFCIPVKSRALRRCIDADKEEWDIVDDEGSEKVNTGNSVSSTVTDVSSTVASARGPPRKIHKQPVRVRSAIKPMAGKVAVVKPIRPAPQTMSKEQQENVHLASPRPTRSTALTSPSRNLTPIRRGGVASDRRVVILSPQRASPRLAPSKKRKRSDVETSMDPERKRRTSARLAIHL